MVGKLLVGAAMLLGVQAAMAEVHYVPSGINNLLNDFVNGNAQVAGKSFQEGDTLVLIDDGPYINASLTFPANVVIRAAQGVMPDFDVASGTLTFSGDAFLQGLNINEIMHFNSDSDYIVAESIMNSSNSADSQFSGSPNSLTLIANHLTTNISNNCGGVCLRTNPSEISAKKLYMTGNSIVMPAAKEDRLKLINSGTGQAIFMGNIIRADISEFSTNDNLLSLTGRFNVVGNRFSQTSNKEAAFGSGFLKIGAGTSGSLVQNNSFQMTSDVMMSNSTDPWHFIQFAPKNGMLDVFNNVFYVDTPSSPAIDGNAIMYDASSRLAFSNNIVVNYSGQFIEKFGLSTIQNNICFNNDQLRCSTFTTASATNLLVDPLFASTEIFTLAAGSPAIDAGMNGTRHLDSGDQSRNDIGVYGGAFPIAFFDQQREPNETKPYLYPLIHVQDTATQSTLHVKALAYARQNIAQ